MYMNILGNKVKGVSVGMPPAYNKVVKYLPPVIRRKRLSSDEREFDKKYFIVDKTDNILSLFFKIPRKYNAFSTKYHAHYHAHTHGSPS